MSQIETAGKERKVPYTVGEQVVNIARDSRNFKKTGRVAGFTTDMNHVVVQYPDKSFGLGETYGQDYLKIKDYLPQKRK